jgi:indole-3-glycerol phosphate synthase
VSDFLATMARERLESVLRNGTREPVAGLRARAEERRGEKRSFEAALRRGTGDPLRVVAELKRASPSAGVLQSSFDPAALAKEYESCGASAVSVLTEPSRFLGSIEDLERARGAVSIPVLLKDFVVHERQIYEGAARGADAVLLIVAMLESDQLRDYATLIAELGMTALVEVHEEREIEPALDLPGAIGVNNRDLRDLAIRRGHAERLLERIPTDRVRVGESGYRTRPEIDALDRAGADAVLIGETLLRAATPREAFEELFGPGSGGRSRR